MIQRHNFAKDIRERVVELGLADEVVTAWTELSPEELHDIRRYEDEIYDVVPLASVRKLFVLLGWDFLRLVGAALSQDSRVGVDLRSERLRRGMSINELAEQLGFEPWVIEAIEADILAVSRYPLLFAIELASALAIPLDRLLATLDRRLEPQASGGARGFTLLELLVVIVIVGLLAAYVGPRLFGQVGRSEQVVAKSQVEAFSRALAAFRLDVGYFPTNEQGLVALSTAPSGTAKWNGPYLDKAVPPDPWGKAYMYRSPGTEGRDFDITSFGKDGAPGGTGDAADITNR